MKVGIDCRLPFYQMGGISQYILHLLPSLAQLDQEGEYRVFHSRKDPRSHLPVGATNFVRRNLYTPCHHRFERWAQSAELLFQDLDLYHSPDFIPPAFGARKRIITVHDLNFVHSPEFLTAESRRYYLDQIEWAVSEADHIVADSDHTRQDLIRLLGVGEERITTVYLAANPIYSAERSDEEIDVVLKKYELVEGFILFVGTISPRKNVWLLIEAYEKLHGEMGFKKPLVLVGAAGWLSQDVLGEIDRQKAASDIRHLVDVSDYELSCLYNAAGVLTIPSYYEGFGLPALEAMHCGCPVISSNRGSLPEIVGEAGKLLDPDDLESWIEAIDLMASDEPLRDQARQKGLEQAAKFTWHRTASETLEIYRRSVS